MISRKEVSLSLYNAKISVDYELPSDQLRFSGMPQDIIDRDKENPLKHLVIVQVRGEAAGFLELDESDDRKKYSNNPYALLLRGFSVNPKYQGRGIATGSIYALQDFILREFPSFNEIVLGVNAKNAPAKKLFEKAGFEDTGRRFMRQSGEQIVMCMRIEKERQM